MEGEDARRGVYTRTQLMAVLSPGALSFLTLSQPAQYRQLVATAIVAQPTNDINFVLIPCNNPSGKTTASSSRGRYMSTSSSHTKMSSRRPFTEIRYLI